MVNKIYGSALEKAIKGDYRNSFSIINKPLLEKIIRKDPLPILVLNPAGGDLPDIIHQTINLFPDKDFSFIAELMEVTDTVIHVYEAISSNDYGLVITGLVGREQERKYDLPVEEGVLFLNCLQRQQLPALVLTAHDDANAVHECNNVLGYFTKPVDQKRLLYVLHHYAAGKVK